MDFPNDVWLDLASQCLPIGDIINLSSTNKRLRVVLFRFLFQEVTFRGPCHRYGQHHPSCGEILKKIKFLANTLIYQHIRRINFIDWKGSFSKIDLGSWSPVASPLEREIATELSFLLDDLPNLKFISFAQTQSFWNCEVTFVEYAYEKTESSIMSDQLVLPRVHPNEDYLKRIIEQSPLKSIVSVALSYEMIRAIPPSALAHVHRLDIIPSYGSYVLHPVEQVVKDINAVLCANVSGIQHFSLQTYRESLFAPLPDSLPHLRTFHGYIYTLKYLHTSPHLCTVRLFDEHEDIVMGILPTLPVDLVARITGLAFDRLSKVSQQFLDLINITLTNVETFGFGVTERPNQSSFVDSLNAVSGFKRLRWLTLYSDIYSFRDTMGTSVEEKACHPSCLLQEVSIMRRTGDWLVVEWDRERGWVEAIDPGRNIFHSSDPIFPTSSKQQF